MKIIKRNHLRLNQSNFLFFTLPDGGLEETSSPIIPQSGFSTNTKDILSSELPPTETDIKSTINLDPDFERRLQEHIQALKELLSHDLPLRVRQIILDRSVDSTIIQAVLLGVKPGSLLELLSEEDIQLLKNTPALSENFLIQDSGIFDPTMIMAVVKNNPECFKDDQNLTPKEIIHRYFCYPEQPDPEHRANLQVGLLLGYPRSAVDDFARLDKAKGVLFLRKIIPPTSPDRLILEEIIKEITPHLNRKKSRNFEGTSYPPTIYEKLGLLFVKYLPPDISSLSCEKLKSTHVRVEGIDWAEQKKSPDAELLKQVYRQALTAPALIELMDTETDKLYRQMMNDEVIRHLSETDFSEIKRLIQEIRQKGIRYSLEHLIAINCNPWSGASIETADDLIAYLKIVLQREK